MEIGSLLGAACVVMTGICVGLAMPSVCSRCSRFFRSAKARTRIRHGGETGESGVDADPGRSKGVLSSAGELVRMLLEGGIPMLSGLASRLMRISSVRRHAENVCVQLAGKGYVATPSTVCQCLIPPAVVLALLLWLVSGSFVVGVLICALVFLAVNAVLSRNARNWDGKVVRDLPDALNAIGVYYESGLTLMQAFEQVSGEVEEPLSGMLGNVSSDLRAGRSLEEALERLRNASNVGALSFVAVSLEIQQRTGGAFQQLLKGAADSVTESLEMEEFLEVKTAQSRLSAKIVSVLPLVLFLLMSLMDASYATAFFESALGIGVFSLAIGLELLGILMIRKILDVDTGR